MCEKISVSDEKITFKKVQRRNIRTKIVVEDSVSDEDESHSLNECLEENRELRKIRKKQNGINFEALLAGRSKEKTKKDDDPFKMKSGGMIDLHSLKNAAKVDDAYSTGIGTSFSAETNRRDEDAQMQKFIEENLAKRRGVLKEDKNKPNEEKYLSPEESALLSVPKYLRESSSKKSEEMLSNQMLNGIPEIDLGLETKIRNIEATEEAKLKVLKESLMKKEKPSEFVPTNVAVNFVQHRRYNISVDHPQEVKKKKQVEREPEPVVEPVVGGGVKISTAAPKRPKNDKASDDFHYEKFKKHMRKY